MMRTLLLALVVAVLAGGCPVSQPPDMSIDLSTPSSLDGNWRISGVETSGADCITVSGTQIVRRDGGCDGSEDEIVAATPALIEGSRVVWTFATVISTGTVPFTLDVTLQSNGTLVGTVHISDLSAGGVNSSNIVMTRE